MDTVTGFTAAKMQEILNTQIATAYVSGYHLWVTHFDGSAHDLGDIRGPAGVAGPTGDVSTAGLAAAILAAKVDTGYGIVAHDEVGTHASWSLSEDTWLEVAGLANTFTPVPGRSYEFKGGIILMSEEAGTYFDVELRSGSTVLARANGYGLHENRSCGINPSRIFAAPGDWTTSKTIKMFVRFSTAFEVHVESDYCNTWLSTVDVGVL